MIRRAPRPVDDTGVLTNRKKHRAMRAGVSRATMFLTGKVTKRNKGEKIMTMFLAEKAYLEPPDNEAKAVLKCFFCNEYIYEGDNYYVLNGFDCCEECLDIHFKFTAEFPDYDS